MFGFDFPPLTPTLSLLTPKGFSRREAKECSRRELLSELLSKVLSELLSKVLSEES